MKILNKYGKNLFWLIFTIIIKLVFPECLIGFNNMSMNYQKSTKILFIINCIHNSRSFVPHFMIHQKFQRWVLMNFCVCVKYCSSKNKLHFTRLMTDVASVFNKYISLETFFLVETLKCFTAMKIYNKRRHFRASF